MVMMVVVVMVFVVSILLIVYDVILYRAYEWHVEF